MKTVHKQATADAATRPTSDGPAKTGSTRRQFLTRGSGFLAWTSIGGGLGGTALDALFPETAGAQVGTDYRALVCVFLAGGNDSFNMVLPLNDSGSAPHGDYSTTRGSIGLTAGEWRRLTLNMSDDTKQAVHPRYSEYGIHAQLPYLRDQFNAGNAAFIANVGNLGRYQPGDLSSELPKSLYAHNSQIEQWQTAGDETNQSGWVGRLGDTFDFDGDGDASLFGNPFKFISLAGNNVLQLGENSENFVATPFGAVPLIEPGSDVDFFALGTDGLTDFQALYMDILTGALDNNERYMEAWEKDVLGTEQGAVDLIERLRLAAVAAGDITADEARLEREAEDAEADITTALKGIVRHMAAAQAENVGVDLPVRQVFFVIDGGYDHHQNVKTAQNAKFTQLNRALERFWVTAERAGLHNNTTLFSASEFGRTMIPSNKGSDHGWGGNSFVMGRHLAGGDGDGSGGVVYGKFPTLARRESDPLIQPEEKEFSRYDGTRGRVIPSTSIEEYFAELAIWLGVKNEEELQSALPDLAPTGLPPRWVAGEEPTLPIGFMDVGSVNSGQSLSGAELTFAASAGPIGPPVGIDLLDLHSTNIFVASSMSPVVDATNTWEIQAAGFSAYLWIRLDTIDLAELELRLSGVTASDPERFMIRTTTSSWYSPPELRRTVSADGSVAVVLNTRDGSPVTQVYVKLDKVPGAQVGAELFGRQ